MLRFNNYVELINYISCRVHPKVQHYIITQESKCQDRGSTMRSRGDIMVLRCYAINCKDWGGDPLGEIGLTW